MEIIKAAALIIVCIFIVSSLPVMDKSIYRLIEIATTVIVLIYIVNLVSAPLEQIKSFMENTGISDFSVIFKAVGISFITQFVSDVATDSGNKALANLMVFTGKIAIIILALPMFNKVLSIIGSLII